LKKFLRQFDLWLVIIPVVFSATSVATIYALVKNGATTDANLWWKQVIFIAMGLLLAAFLSFVDYRYLRNFSWPLYIIAVILLVVVIFSKEVAGASRWLQIGFFQFQPSEFFKIALIFWQAHYLSKSEYLDIPSAIPFLLVSFLPVFLILKQPDLGTAIIVIGITLGTLLLAKPRRSLLITIMVFIVLFCLLIGLSAFRVSFFGKILKDYQRERILTFLDPNRDPKGSGYNLNQSKMAIGSAGIWGKGFRGNSQTQLKFVPAPATDFIFAALAEAFGFIGGILLILLYLLFILRIIFAAEYSRDGFGQKIAVGLFFMFTLQFFINVGMTMGLAPITGIPLPFLSYGGSSILTAFLAVGVIQSIVIRHKILEF
jgi:rod shape determining protein RodA